MEPRLGLNSASGGARIWDLQITKPALNLPRERFCSMETHLQWEKFPPPERIESGRPVNDHLTCVPPVTTRSTSKTYVLLF